jgi:predicted  nucleic acid-binding Zn-ribbon protein
MRLEETVAKLRSEVTAAQRRHANASAQAAQANARADAIREDLESEFGVTTVAEAREKLAGLKEQLTAQVAEVQRHLGVAGGAA